MTEAIEFKNLQAPAKNRIVEFIINGADSKLLERIESEREVGLSQFYWFHLDTTDPLTKAVATKLSKTTTRLFNNYRGSKKAWYLGSQNDRQVIAAFERTVTWLRQQGVKCYLCAEPD